MTMQLNTLCPILLLSLFQVAFASPSDAADHHAVKHMMSSSEMTKRANIFAVEPISHLVAVGAGPVSGLSKRQVPLCDPGFLGCTNIPGYCCDTGTYCVQIAGQVGCCDIGKICTSIGCTGTQNPCGTDCCDPGMTCTTDSSGTQSCSPGSNPDTVVIVTKAVTTIISNPSTSYFSIKITKYSTAGGHTSSSTPISDSPQNPMAPPINTNPINATSINTTPINNSPPKNSPKIAVIVGASLAGLAVLLVFAFLLVLLRQRKKRENSSSTSPQFQHPNHPAALGLPGAFQGPLQELPGHQIGGLHPQFKENEPQMVHNVVPMVRPHPVHELPANPRYELPADSGAAYVPK